MNGGSPFGPSALVNPATFAAFRAAALTNSTVAIMYRANLVGVCENGNVPPPEIYAAVGAGTVEALEQLAAQYGLLKPGTQGAT